jgi:hypothetical protein
MRNTAFTFLIGLVLLAYSCVSFETRIIRKEISKIRDSDIANLDGKFSSMSFKFCSKKGEYEYLERELLMELNREKLSPPHPQTIESYYVKLIGLDTLWIQGLDTSGSVVMDYKFPGYIKNGFFYLNNKFVDCNGIPYIIGGCRTEKTRITLSKDKDLIVQSAIDNSGAFLLIIGTGYTYNIATFFKPVNN